MKIKYVFKSIIVFLCIFSSDSIKSIPAEISAYFLPKDAVKISESSILQFDEAKEQVLVSVYWITSNSFIDKLIDLKRRGVDVQVIYDASSPNVDRLTHKFIQNDIMPIVSIFSDFDEGKMHNKFLVFDNIDVWTGSANYTEVAFNPTENRKNDENVVIINSKEIAKKYKDIFFEMERKSFEFYIEVLLKYSNLPGWLNYLIRELYNTNIRFNELVNRSLRNLNADQFQKLANYFPDLITPKQKKFLEEHGYQTTNIDKNIATFLIGKIIEKENESRKRARYGASGCDYAKRPV